MRKPVHNHKVPRCSHGNCHQLLLSNLTVKAILLILGPAYNVFGYNEHPATTSSFLCTDLRDPIYVNSFTKQLYSMGSVVIKICEVWAAVPWLGPQQNYWSNHSLIIMLENGVAQPHYYYCTRAITICFNCINDKILSILLCTDHILYLC